MKFEEKVNSGLKRASRDSRRDGKWTIISEVREESHGVPISVRIRAVLMQLVKENRAEKKKGFELWRPAGMGAGGYGKSSGLKDTSRGMPNGYERGEPETSRRTLAESERESERETPRETPRETGRERPRERPPERPRERPRETPKETPKKKSRRETEDVGNMVTKSIGALMFGGGGGSGGGVSGR